MERQNAAAAAPGIPGELVWRAHPARERLPITILLVAVIAALAGVTAALFRDAALTVLALLILGSSLAPWFLPTSYRMSDDGAAARRAGLVRARRWEEIRSVYVDAHGVTLSPFAGRKWLEPYRALRLLFSGNRDEVVSHLWRRLEGRCRTGAVRWIGTTIPASER